MTSTFVRKTSVTVAVLVAGVCVMASLRATAPEPAQATTAQKSVGRGWPVAVVLVV